MNNSKRQMQIFPPSVGENWCMERVLMYTRDADQSDSFPLACQKKKKAKGKKEVTKTLIHT